MSKLLKIIVNVFLIGAILIAAAILIPPLAGVTTTIVDTSAMNTNLPLGSVTYSTDVDVFQLKAGDEILKENDSSTYAYIIKETDAANGRFQAVSSTDPNGAQEEIRLRNSVPKVAVIIPYIGYILIAMHSIEGIIIVVLIVVLMIILFILSELWKTHPEDEEEDEEEETGETREEPQVTAKEETGIDTEAIRAAVAENHNAALGMEDEALGREVDELQAAAGTVVSDTTVIEELSSVTDVPPAAPEADSVALDAFVFGTAAAAAAAPSGETAEAESGAGPQAGNGRSLPPYVETEEDRRIAEALLEYDLDAPKEAAPAADGRPFEDSGVPLAVFPEPKLFEAAEPAPEAQEERFSPWQEPGLPELNDSLDGLRPEAVSDDTKRFVPVSRPSYEDILKENEGGKDPSVRKDEKSGISVVDLSDQL